MILSMNVQRHLAMLVNTRGYSLIAAATKTDVQIIHDAASGKEIAEVDAKKITGWLMEFVE